MSCAPSTVSLLCMVPFPPHPGDFFSREVPSIKSSTVGAGRQRDSAPDVESAAESDTEDERRDASDSDFALIALWNPIQLGTERGRSVRVRAPRSAPGHLPSGLAAGAARAAREREPCSAPKKWLDRLSRV